MALNLKNWMAQGDRPPEPQSLLSLLIVAFQPMPTYSGISSEAFRHLLEREAEKALRSIPGFDLVASQFEKSMYERAQIAYHLKKHGSVETPPMRERGGSTTRANLFAVTVFLVIRYFMADREENSILIWF